MILEIFLALLLGVTAGTFTGATPSLHINLILPIILSFSNDLGLSLVCFIVAFSFGNIIFSFAPSILVGAPQDESFISILPGHEMLKEGCAHEAILITAIASLFSVFAILINSVFFIFFLPSLFSLIKKTIPFLLIFISFYLIFRNKNPTKSFICFALSGFLGIFAFNLPVKQPLLPVLSGLFGLSSIIISLKDKISIPEQKIINLNKIFSERKLILKPLFTSIIFTPLGSLFPGIGAGHATTIATETTNLNKKEFLFVASTISVSALALSFITTYSIQKTRTFSAFAILSILKKILFKDILIILIISIISIFISSILLILISKKLITLFNKINYFYLNLFVIITIVFINLIFTNLLGLLVLLTATSIGTYTILSETRRINLMASLILPSILYSFLF